MLINTLAPVDTDAERAILRAELARRSMIRDAEALPDWDAFLRQSDRAARADMLASDARRLPSMSDADRKRLRAVWEAKRRDSLSYPLTPVELVTACQQATLTARKGRTFVPPEDVPDVSQGLALEVVRRHGPQPLRASVDMSWLRQRALGVWLDMERARERATGRRAAADELHDWQRKDARAVRAEAMASADSVYTLAANRPAVDLVANAVTAEQIATNPRLPLTFLQRDSVRVALSSARNRPLTNRERQHLHCALKVLRERFPTREHVRAAVRPLSYVAALVVGRAATEELRRAGIASHGSGTASGGRDMAGRLPCSISRAQQATLPPPTAMAGPTEWNGQGNGYSGACSALYLYRTGVRRSGNVT